MSQYYYKDTEARMVGPVGAPDLLALYSAGVLTDESEVCIADKEVWTTFIAAEIPRPKPVESKEMTLSVFPTSVFIAVFIWLYFVAKTNYTMLNNAAALFYGDIHLFYLIAAFILFRVLNYSYKIYWVFIAATIGIGFAHSLF